MDVKSVRAQGALVPPNVIFGVVAIVTANHCRFKI